MQTQVNVQNTPKLPTSSLTPSNANVIVNAEPLKAAVQMADPTPEILFQDQKVKICRYVCIICKFPLFYLEYFVAIFPPSALSILVQFQH